MDDRAPPTADELRGVVDRLRASSVRLRARSAGALAATLGSVGARFRSEGDPLRVRALEALPDAAKISAPMARAVLDGMARDWTAERLLSVLDAELGGPAPLDGFVDGPFGLSRMAVGPALCVQIVAGSVPGVSVHALLRSLLVKGPTLVKPGAGDALLPALFGEGLAEADADLAESLAVVYWPRGSEGLDDVALQAADVAVVYGSDETVRALRGRAPASTRVVGYHHRVGIGLVGRELTRDRLDDAALALARAVVLFERRGCVCPQVVWVEEGGPVAPSGFARLLASALQGLEEALPSPPRALDDGARLRQMRETAELRAAAEGTEVHHGGAAGSWTVVYEPEPTEGPDGFGRVVRVRPLDDASSLAAALEPIGRHLQSVGYAGLGSRLVSVAAALGRVGASRLTPFGSMPFPPPWWLHDGRGPLLDLIRWVEVEDGRA